MTIQEALQESKEAREAKTTIFDFVETLVEDKVPTGSDESPASVQLRNNLRIIRHDLIYIASQLEKKAHREGWNLHEPEE